ncbi:hypothetical protein KCU85_g7461, partial [Aureobasidium melanogenum]
MLPSIAYRVQPLAPTFGRPTARANFCEQDFVIVSWIAEFVNTCSNAAHILYAIRALRRMPTSAPFAGKRIYYCNDPYSSPRLAAPASPAYQLR